MEEKEMLKAVQSYLDSDGTIMYPQQAQAAVKMLMDIYKETQDVKKNAIAVQGLGVLLSAQYLTLVNRMNNLELRVDPNKRSPNSICPDFSGWTKDL